MNTKNKQNQKNQRQTRQRQEPKKQGQNPSMLQGGQKHHEQEHPETRMTR